MPWPWIRRVLWHTFSHSAAKLFFRVSSITCLLLSLVGIVSVLLGRAWKFPIIGDWAARL